MRNNHYMKRAKQLWRSKNNMKSQEMWSRFCSKSGINPATHYEAWQFGGAPDNLAALVIQTIQLDVIPFDEVGADQARGEGEGDFLGYYHI